MKPWSENAGFLWKTGNNSIVNTQFSTGQLFISPEAHLIAKCDDDRLKISPLQQVHTTNQRIVDSR